MASTSQQQTDVFANLDRHSVDALCSIGREIVQELIIRTTNLMALMKAKHNSADHPSVESLTECCMSLFQKLNEIRLIIDQRRMVANMCDHISDMEMIDILTDSVTPPENPRCQELLDKVNEEQAKIVTLKCRLKLLEWLSTVSDQRTIKKADLCGDENR